MGLSLVDLRRPDIGNPFYKSMQAAMAGTDMYKALFLSTAKNSQNHVLLMGSSG